MRVKSFDVFDTLLTRKVGLPGHIFLLTGQRIAEQFGLGIEPDVFANARAIAEKELVRHGLVSSDIYDIYKKLTDTLELPEELAPRLAGAELEIEYREITAVKKNADLVERLRSEGEQVIYISDMYLGEPVIRKLLTDHGIYREGERIYVSCDHGVNKSSGKLFDVVADDLGIEKHQLHHFGNSMWSDIKGAEKAGVGATYLSECNLNRYEKHLCSVNENHRLTVEQTLLYSRMAAASRLSRLERNAQDKEIYDVASSVAAPILYRFVDYVLTEAGDRKIYFLARDGHIMHQIAERIIKARGYKTEIKYLYISREVLVLAMFDEKRVDELLDLFKKIYAYETLDYIFKLFSITNEILKDCGLMGIDKTKKLSAFKDEEISSLLFKKQIFKQIQIKSKKRKKSLLDYLIAEGLFENEQKVIVDTGWNLSIQNLLAELLTEFNIEVPSGYYLGINENAFCTLNSGNKNGFLWDLRKNIKPPKLSQYTIFLEIICPPIHGRTIGYKSMDGFTQPILDDIESKYLLNWGSEDLFDGIMNSIKWMLKLDRKVEAFKKDVEIIIDHSKLFWCFPTISEIQKWGQYPFLISRDGRSVTELFRKRTFFKLLKLVLVKGKLTNSSLDYWPHAYIYSLGKLKRVSVRYSLRLKRKLHLFKHIK